MTPEELERIRQQGPGPMIFAVPAFRRRSWAERLFTWPWRPWVASERNAKAIEDIRSSIPSEVAQFFEQQRQAAPPRRSDIHIPECPHCAVRGMVELWSHRHARHIPPNMRRLAILGALANVVEEYSTPAPEPVGREH